MPRPPAADILGSVFRVKGRLFGPVAVEARSSYSVDEKGHSGRLKGGASAIRKGAGRRITGKRGGQAVEILRNAWLRVTSCRTSLMDLLLNAKEPLTQKDLMKTLEGYRIEAQAMYLWGLCPECLQETEPTR